MDVGKLDQPFDREDLKALETVLPDGREFLSELLTTRHGAVDLKRGDLYVEILRAEGLLRSLLAAAYELPPSNVQFGNGSNGSIDSLLTLPLVDNSGHKPRLVTIEPTYFRVYASARARGYEHLSVATTVDDQPDIKSICEAISAYEPDAVFMCSPNNPTGTTLSDSGLSDILNSCGSKTFVVLDRTLADISDATPTKALLKRHRGQNLVILHSFSKYCEMSQFRVGAMLFANDDLAVRHRGLCPLGVSLEGCIRAACHVAESGTISPKKVVVERIREASRALLGSHRAGMRVSRFAGNYGLITFDEVTECERMLAALARVGISVLPGTQFPKPIHNTFRIHTAMDSQSLNQLTSVLFSTT